MSNISFEKLMISGHRPQGFTEEEKEFALDVIPYVISKMIDSNNIITQGNSGMALGVDTWFYHFLEEQNIPVTAYIPFKGQENKWSQEDKKNYRENLKKVKNIIYMGESFNNKYYHMRNDKMIEDSTIVFIVISSHNKTNGAYSVLKKAKQLKKKIILLNCTKGTIRKNF